MKSAAMNKESKIFVAGHRGMVGSAIVRRLQAEGFTQILTRNRSDLDLLDRLAVRRFFEIERPEFVFDAAARVGGIIANSEKPVEFLIENLTIQNNVIQAAADFGAAKLLFLGSSCIYPKLAPQPISEDSLLTGPLEPTNDAYALAKIAGIKLCQSYAKQYGKNFISAMPTNLYGPNDNFDLRSSHVLPALIRKVHEAKTSGARTVAVWGTGTPRREFLHVDDLADACLFLLNNYDSPEIVNIGCGEDFTIRELVETVCETLGFDGDLVFDTSKPDGTPRKLLNIKKIRSLGWTPRIPLREGILDAYTWFLKSAR
jgi:GDP-L-fucose synthase